VQAFTGRSLNFFGQLATDAWELSSQLDAPANNQGNGEEAKEKVSAIHNAEAPESKHF
jgi:hypothetical protein